MSIRAIGSHVPLPKGPGCVYSVTTIAQGKRYGGTRTVAICSKFSTANKMICNNCGDMCECSYGFAVVEELALDSLYGDSFGESGRAQYWYAWQGDPRDGRYVPIETPAQMSGYREFAVG